jgi:hypothetical protein
MIGASEFRMESDKKKRYGERKKLALLDYRILCKKAGVMHVIKHSHYCSKDTWRSFLGDHGVRSDEPRVFGFMPVLKAIFGVSDSQAVTTLSSSDGIWFVCIICTR